MARISIVGTGPGSLDYVIPMAKRVVQNAEVVIGAERSLSLLACCIKGETIKLTAKNINETLKEAIELAQNGKNVAILSTGDPGFSGLLNTFFKVTRSKEVDVNVVPGISSIQVCAARLLIPWDATHLFSFHEGVDAKTRERLARDVQEKVTVLVLPDSRNFTPREIAKFLLGCGVDAGTPVFVCENLTLDDERVVSSTLGEVQRSSFGSLCVMVIKPGP